MKCLAHSTTFSVSALSASRNIGQNTRVLFLPFPFLLHLLTLFSLCFVGGGPFWLAVQGKTYHRLFPTDRADHPAHWFLYDSSARSHKAAQQHIPEVIVDDVRFDLAENNPLFHYYKSFADFRRDETHAYMELRIQDAGNGREIAALHHVGNSPMPLPRNPRLLRKQREGSTQRPNGSLKLMAVLDHSFLLNVILSLFQLRHLPLPFLPPATYPAASSLTLA